MAKDKPRFKCISQYENELKKGFAKNLGKALDEILKKIKKLRDA